MMTSNVDRMEAAALARAGSETLVKRLRNPLWINDALCNPTIDVDTLRSDAFEAAAAIRALHRPT